MASFRFSQEDLNPLAKADSLVFKGIEACEPVQLT